MMTVLVVVFLLKGHPDVQSFAIPFEPRVTVQECKLASGPVLQEIPRTIQMLGWACISMPFTKAVSL
jgi:hypothetical protein